MADFTPGPWKWRPGQDPEDGYTCNTYLDELVSESGGRILWLGSCEQYYPTAGEEPNEADAALIAAAPDLFREAEKALEDLEVATRLLKLEPEEDYFSDSKMGLRAALRKAKKDWERAGRGNL